MQEGVDPDLGEVGLAGPAVMKFRSEADQEHDPRTRKTIYEAVDKGHRLLVDGVQVLENEQERPYFALAEQQPFDGFEDSLPALRPVRGGRLRVVGRRIEQQEQCWQPRQQRFIQPHELGGDLLANGLQIVGRGELEIAPEEFRNRQVAGGRAVGERAGFEDVPEIQVGRAGELVDETSLPTPGSPTRATI